jgi:hypothetical protein
LLNADPEFIRIIVHDIKKDAPDFMNYRNRSNYGYLLKSLLSSYDGETDRLYYEVCSMKVAIIDTSDVVRFDVFSDNVTSLLPTAGCVVMPKYATNKDLFTLIRAQIPPEICAKLGPLRILSSYLHTIWSVYHLETDPPSKEVRSLYSSSSYRVEEIPKEIPDTKEKQEMFDFCHFSYVGGRVDRHSDAFSMYVLESDTPETVLARVNKKLDLPADQQIKAKLFVVAYDDYWNAPKVIGKDESVMKAMNTAPGRDLHVGLEHAAPRSAQKPLPKDSPLVIRN